MGARTIKVDYLARVEGEGGLTIRFKDGRAKEVELRIFEPPRFFEAFLRGRDRLEVPDLTSRICGICPVAYILSACAAVESAAGVRVPADLVALRRLLYCGEWIESHALHVFMLHLPDFLGHPDALSLAAEHPDLVKRGLRMKKAGNALMSAVGGREVHPVNTRVGGFYRAPRRDELEPLLSELRWGREAAGESLEFLATLSFPDLEREYEFVALRHPERYAIEEGRVVSSAGLDVPVDDYEAHFEEDHVPHSTALHSRIRARGAYLCGPLARFGLSFEQLPAGVREAARGAGLAGPCRNPFKSILVRAVELMFAFDEAVRLIESYAPPARSFVETPARAGRGTGATEAPRGMLYHRYEFDAAGLVTSAKIVPPTSQNQRSIEDDLFALAPALLELSHEDATARAEQAVRNHDPCISCATHFLTLRREAL